jgi:hypothetical protein
LSKALKAIDEVKEIKKHHTQMTPTEKTILKTLIRGNFRFTGHCLQRMKERRISRQEVRQTINEGIIVEYHLANGTNSRVLLRGKGFI